MRRRICFLLIGLLGCGVALAEVTNRIVARVNDRILTLYDFETRFQEALRRVGELPADETERENLMGRVARGLMNSLWDDLLILSRADQRGWSISEAEVQSAIDEMKESSGVRSDAELAEALAREGLTFERWKEQIGNQLLYRQVIGREVYSEIRLAEEDLRRYYRSHPEEFRVPEQLQIQEIVVLEQDDSAAMQRLADRLLEQLRAGTAMEDVVAGFSGDELSSIIDLGWVAIGDLDPKIAEALAEIDPGDFSAPIAARGGLHIARLIDRKEETIQPFMEIELALRQSEQNKRLQKKLKDYLIQLEKEAYFTLDAPAVAAGFRTATGETPIEVEFPLMESLEASFK